MPHPAHTVVPPLDLVLLLPQLGHGSPGGMATS